MPTQIDGWSDVAPTVVKPAIYAYKYRKFIQEYWKKLQVLVGIGKPAVIVTGLSGSGKSVLTAHCHGEANSLDWQPPEVSSKVEIKPIAVGDWFQIIHVIPGQNSRERMAGLDKALNSHDGLDGVIHVVNWGYVTIRDKAVQMQMLQDGCDTIEKYRELQLKREIEDFKLMVDRIKLSIASGRGPKWLVLAVNKIDLFESELEQARQHYHPLCKGAFSEVVDDLYQSVGQQNIQVECLPVCAMPESFNWGEHINSPEIDSIIKVKSYLRGFIDNLSRIQQGIN